MSLSFTPSNVATPAPVASSAYLRAPLAIVTSTALISQANILAGTFTPSSTPLPTTCATPDILLIEISTTLTVPNFKHIYHEDIRRFQPQYLATPDGSLISKPFTQDLREAREAILWLGGYLVFFAWNTLVALSFIVRATVPNKSIFYALFASQILDLISWIVQTAAAFENGLDCRPAYQAVEVLFAISNSVVLTGVFGMKAYRCLFNSRWVLAGLVTLQAGYISVVALRIIKTGVHKRLDGFCALNDPDNLAAGVLLSLFVESLFIAICFVVAIWRTSRIAAANGRVSFRESILSHLTSPQASGANEDILTPLPSRIHTRERSTSLVPLVSPIEEKEASAKRAVLMKRRFQTTRRYASKDKRTWAIMRWMDRLREKVHDVFTTSRSLHIAILKPRIELFREVMRDETAYTALLAIVTVVSGVMTLLASLNHKLLHQDQWLNFQTAVMSALAVHSMRRVVRRNEFEAMLNDARVGDPSSPQRAARVGSRYNSYQATRTRSIGFASIHTAKSDSAVERGTAAPARESWQWDTSPRASIGSMPDSGIIDLGRVISVARSTSMASSLPGGVDRITSPVSPPSRTYH